MRISALFYRTSFLISSQTARNIYIYRVSSYLVVFALRRPADLASPLLYNWWNFTRYTCDVSDGRISCSFSRSSYSSYSRRTENEKFSSCSSFFFSPLLFLSYTQARAFRSIVIEIRSTVYQDTIRATFNQICPISEDSPRNAPRFTKRLRFNVIKFLAPPQLNVTYIFERHSSHYKYDDKQINSWFSNTIERGRRSLYYSIQANHPSTFHVHKGKHRVSLPPPSPK